MAGGPIALVEDGDIILIDIPARSLDIVGHEDLRFNPDEVQTLLVERKKKWNPPPEITRREFSGAIPNRPFQPSREPT